MVKNEKSLFHIIGGVPADYIRPCTHSRLLLSPPLPKEFEPLAAVLKKTPSGIWV